SLVRKRMRVWRSVGMHPSLQPPCSQAQWLPHPAWGCTLTARKRTLLPRLEEAVAAYRAALEKRTRERMPLGWAGTQTRSGAARHTRRFRALPARWHTGTPSHSGRDDDVSTITTRR